MKLPRRQVLKLGRAAATLIVISVILLALNSPGAWSQTARTVKIVVPFPPGGPTDTLARLLAEEIGRAQGLTMVVDNRPGAGSVIGTEAVSRAAPDGNTLLIIANSFVINPNLKKLNYDPLSFEPICHLARSPHSSSSTMHRLTRCSPTSSTRHHAQPGELTLATVGPATGPHIAFERLKRVANINMTFVPYAGSALSVNALLGGHVTAAIADYRDVIAQMKAGKLRALATASRTRLEPVPDVPTVAESGYRDYEAEGWFGMVAPAKTPRETASQFAGWLIAALQAPEINRKLVDLGLFPVGMCGVDFGAHLRKQYEEYGRIIREANIKAE
jgi:tripartite-type tricarboxylate transporter receptor subunit TctC